MSKNPYTRPTPDKGFKILAGFLLFIIGFVPSCAGVIVLHKGFRLLVDPVASAEAPFPLVVGLLFLLIGVGLYGRILWVTLIRPRRHRRQNAWTPGPTTLQELWLAPGGPQYYATGWLFALVGSLMTLLLVVAARKDLETEAMLVASLIVGLPTALGYVLTTRDVLYWLGNRRGGKIVVKLSEMPRRGRLLDLEVSIQGPVTFQSLQILVEQYSTHTYVTRKGSGYLASSETKQVGCLPLLDLDHVEIKKDAAPYHRTQRFALPMDLGGSATASSENRKWVITLLGTIHRSGDWRRCYQLYVGN